MRLNFWEAETALLCALFLSVFSLSMTACSNDDSSSPSAVESADDESSDSKSSSSNKDSKSSGSENSKSSASENTKSSSSEKSKSSSSAMAKSSSDENSKSSSSGNSKSSSSGNSKSSSSGTAKSSSSGSDSPSSSGGMNPGDMNLVTCVTEGLVVSRLDDKYKRVDYVCKDSLWIVVEPASSSSGAIHYGMSEQFNSSASFTEFVDKRDKNVYKTVVFSRGGVSFEIFAQNLNYGKQIMSTATEFDDSVVEKYCYDDDPYFCENGFGGLYSWSEAMGLPKACDSIAMGSATACPTSIAPDVEESEWIYVQVQGICPDGWHIMNEFEWTSMVGLENYVLDLMSSEFGSMDDYGVALLPGGVLNTAVSVYYTAMGKHGYMWLPQEYVRNAGRTVVYSNLEWLEDDSFYKKANGMSIRCVKDYKK